MPNTAYPFAGEWTDSQSPALSARVGGTAPTFAAMNGTIYGIKFATNDEIHGSIQLPHSAVGGGELRMHAHFTFAAAPTVGETVIWGLAHSTAAVGGTFPAPTTSTATYTIASTTALVHYAYAIVTITMPTPAESCIVMFRAYRSGGTSAVKPYLLSIDGHFQQGQYGTEPEYPS